MGKFLVVFLVRDTDSFKVGFVASKKVGNAVKRNRAKRLMREIVRISQPLLPKNINLILVARRNLLNATFKEISDSFHTFINRFINNEYKSV